MNFVNDYALLFAVAIPIVTVLGAQVALFLRGERGTLLLPGLNPYPTFERTVRLEHAPRKAVTAQAANDDFERIAA